MSSEASPVAAGGSQIAAALSRVLGRVSWVRKDGKNDHFGYRFVSEAAMYDAIRPLLADEGLAITASVDAVDRYDVERLVRGEVKRAAVTRARMSFTLLHSSGERIGPCSWFGEAADEGDKGLAKAITSGCKYFVFKLAMVSTGDDPELDQDLGPAPRSSAARPSAGGQGDHAAAPAAPAAAEPDRSALHAAARELYRAYLTLLGDAQAASGAMAGVTGKMKSSDYTDRDLELLADNLAERRKAAIAGAA